MRKILTVAAASAIALTAFAHTASAEGELNLYSSRHYDTDERLYSNFEEKTGVKINRIEGKADALIERMTAEGANSPADILLTVDAGRMWRADQAGLLQPVSSEILDKRIPAYLRHPEGRWFSFSQRARIIFYAPERVSEPPLTYEALADPNYKGQVCTRSGSNIYMLSLMASIIEHAGEDAAKSWAEGVYANRARDPEGGDTDQLRALISGQCDIVLSNTYYFARGLSKEVRGLTDGIEQIAWVFPNQSDRGTHMNVSLGAVAKHAPNKDNAIKFLEYLTEIEAQEYFSNGNNEYPAVPGVALSPSTAALGLFRADDINLAVFGENQLAAQRIYDEVGYK